jgi:YggT family protein
MGIIVSLIDLLYWVFWVLILARVILSFVRISPYHPLQRTVYQLTEPFLAPIRRFLPPTSGLDFSPLIALLLLEVVRRVLFGILL